ncbi:unnamed protein product [Clonostachys solani]|uniref:Uncharacterized protein n=1 Tax=Clonostachys solani TaxID=160281 RepID=A0A9P0EMG8_9HYPO|nr:unnamed protein product [Clonostachys solani]
MGSSNFPLANETGEESTYGGSDAGAAGSSSSSGPVLSTGGMIAIIVVIVIVAILGATMATLFFIAKRREWTMKETLRRSARRVKTALTPRRTEFPDYVKNGPISSHRARARLADVPPTPRLRPEDIEKAMAKSEVKSKGPRWPGK